MLNKELEQIKLLGQRVKFRAELRRQRAILRYLRWKSSNSRMSNSHRLNYAKRAKCVEALIIIMSSEDSFSKSGGRREFEFRSYRQILKFAKYIQKELMSTGLSYDDSVLLIALRLLTKYPEIKRAYIPKAGEVNGQRPLGIPPHQTKAIEYLLLRLINPTLIERHHELKELNIWMFGFLPGHNCKQARSIVIKNLKDGFSHCLNGDQSGAFDAVKASKRKELCVNQFGSKIGTVCNAFSGRKVTAKEVGYIDELGMVSYHDKNVEVYRKKFVNGVPSYQVNVKGNGTPQGGVISPNIFWLTMSKVLELFIAKRGDNGDIRIVCYADDFIIMTKEDTSTADKELLMNICSEYGLNLNRDKTYHSYNSTSFLGWVINSKGYQADMKHVNGRNFKYILPEIPGFLEEIGNEVWNENDTWNDAVNEVIESWFKPSKLKTNKGQVTELALSITTGILRYYGDLKPSVAVKATADKLRSENPRLPSFIQKQLSTRKPTAERNTRLASETECSKFLEQLTTATVCVAPDSYLDDISQNASNVNCNGTEREACGYDGITGSEREIPADIVAQLLAQIS